MKFENWIARLDPVQLSWCRSRLMKRVDGLHERSLSCGTHERAMVQRRLASARHSLALVDKQLKARTS